jgi:hypothetical protein
LLSYSLVHVSFVVATARWAQNGVTVAGGRGQGSATNQLNWPWGLFVDEDDTVVVADYENHRIVEWKQNATNGTVLAGGNGGGKRPDQLNLPTDVILDKETDSLIICDRSNRRVTRWPRRSSTRCGETIIDSIACWGLAIDDAGSVYVTDTEKHEVKRYRRGISSGIVVAGGNGKGVGLNQLNWPTFVCVDRQHAVYPRKIFRRKTAVYRRILFITSVSYCAGAVHLRKPRSTAVRITAVRKRRITPEPNRDKKKFMFTVNFLFREAKRQNRGVPTV